MNLAIYNNTKLIFIGNEGCCVIDNVGYRKAVVVYAYGDVYKSYNNFLCELMMTTGSSSKSKINNLLDKGEYDSCKKRGGMLDVLFVDKELYDAIEVDFSFYDRLICVGDEIFNSGHGAPAIELATTGNCEFMQLQSFLGFKFDGQFLYNLITKSNYEANLYKKRADTLLGL